MTRVWTYSLKKLDDAAIKQLIGQDTYTYIVATRAMAGERRALLPSDQKNRDKKQAVFQDFISLWLEKASESVARRDERNVLLPRAIDNVNLQNPQLADILMYPSRDREMLACINQIREWLISGFKPEQISVVMRSPGDLKNNYANASNSSHSLLG